MSLTRRQLLASATALSGVAILPREGHKLVSEEETDATDTQGRNPNYVDGVVVWTRPGMVHVKDRWFKRAPAELRIVPGTDICRGPCGWYPS